MPTKRRVPNCECWFLYTTVPTNLPLCGYGSAAAGLTPTALEPPDQKVSAGCFDEGNISRSQRRLYV
jgi:hypothetical protein